MVFGLQLLKKFEDHVDKEDGEAAVVGYDGFDANASVRVLLDSLCEEVMCMPYTFGAQYAYRRLEHDGVLIGICTAAIV